MKSKSLSELETLLELKFQRKQRVFAKMLAEEGRLRAQITRLDAQDAEAQKSNVHELRALGADVIWNTWLERSKKKVNLELAQVLAQKYSLQGAVQREYGKLLVSRELLSEQRETETEARRSHMLQTAIENHLQRTHSDRKDKT